MRTEECDLAVEKALALIEECGHVYDRNVGMFGVIESKNYWLLRLKNLDDEQFDVAFLDGQNRVIACETLFTGSISSSVVYPRTILKSILKYNAVSIVLAHNHPSGSTNPSEADKNITNKIKNLCSEIDVKVLDHIIVGDQCFSFAESGLM